MLRHCACYFINLAIAFFLQFFVASTAKFTDRIGFQQFSEKTKFRKKRKKSEIGLLGHVSTDNYYVINNFSQKTDMSIFEILSAKFQGNMSKVANEVIKIKNSVFTKFCFLRSNYHKKHEFGFFAPKLFKLIDSVSKY